MKNKIKGHKTDTQYIVKKKLLARFWRSFYRLAREYRNVGCLGKGKQGGGGLRAGPQPRSPQPTSFPRLPQQHGEALRRLLAWQRCPGMLAAGKLRRCLCPNMRQIWSRGGKLLFLGKDSHRAAGESSFQHSWRVRGASLRAHKSSQFYSARCYQHDPSHSSNYQP